MTNKNKIIKNVFNELERINCKGKVISALHLKDIYSEIQEHRKQNLFDSDFYDEYKNYFESQQELELSQINSLFIIAFPHPATRLIFHLNNKEYILLIPPTYLKGREMTDQLKLLLKRILALGGYQVSYARIPAKTLAVHSGLAEYGKNNITYIQGLGSFYRLSVFYSDLLIEQDEWHEFRLMQLCEKCSACVRNCPTGAIPSDRFLLRAERCLTYHNEHPPETPFPDWINPEWHNCLVGCLHCQQVCPANKKVINWIESGVEFSQEETELFLDGVTIDQLPNETVKKLKKNELIDYLELFPRNLKGYFQN